MPAKYPVLHNKAIDQWRVTELREELRRRNLVTKGLKEELVKRLDEDIQKDEESKNVGELGMEDVPNLSSQFNADVDYATPEGANILTLLEETDNTDKDASMVITVLDVNIEHEAQYGDTSEVTSLVGKDCERATMAGDLEGSVPEDQTFIALSENVKSDKFDESNSLNMGIDENLISCDLKGITPVNQENIDRSDMQGDVAKLEKFELKIPIVGTDENEITNYLKGSAPFSQNFTDHFNTQGEGALPVNFEESKIPIVGTDEKETSNDLKGSAQFSQNITDQFNVQSEDPYSEKFKEFKSLRVESAAIKLEQSNQVSETTQNLEFPVKSKSNSIYSLSTNEKNIFKDNLTADHFPLELVAKQEVAQTSSNSYSTGGDHSCGVYEQTAAQNHVTDEQVDLKSQFFVGQEVVQNLLSVKQEINTQFSCQRGRNEERAYLNDPTMQNASTFDSPKKENCVQVGSPEKLNLDRSSSDESMEEDLMDIKHMEVDVKSKEPTTNIEAKTLDIKLDERTADNVSKPSFKLKDITVDDIRPASLAEKRNLEAEAVVISGPPKRHRRWNPETIKAPEQQTPLNISTTPSSNFQPKLHGSFSRTNSSVSVDSPKELIVPPPKRPATSSLRIDNFVRPFTIKAAQELLAKTGHVCEFWMDAIKTHCFVTYSSVEEATETRNAVYNLQWPPNGGRLLAAEFVDPQEVKLRLEAPPPSPAPIRSNPVAPKAPPSQPTLSTHQQIFRLHPPPPPPAHSPPAPPSVAHLPPPPPMPLPNPPIARERLPPPPPKPEPPVMTLDDLFQKTRATPRIYYQPLTEEQAQAKLASQSKRTQA